MIIVCAVFALILLCARAAVLSGRRRRGTVGAGPCRRDGAWDQGGDRLCGTPGRAGAGRLKDLSGQAAGTVLSPGKLDPDHPELYFDSCEIKGGGAVHRRIDGRSYRENPDVALEDLRYLKVLHYNFDHEIQVGELIVHRELADEMLEICRALFDAGYEICSMRLVDDYWTGDAESSDSASVEANNTSAFNYRPIVGGRKLSSHAYGLAVDINPQQNPYVSFREGRPCWEHENSSAYIDRGTGLPHVITHEDFACRLLRAHGFIWGGDWTDPKDYQHFEKNKISRNVAH